MKKKHGFTLAETLITLTIIGVVAAMTIPTLISKYQKHVFYTAFMKAHSTLENAFKMIYVNENCPVGDLACLSFSFDTTYDSAIKNTNLLAKQMKVVKICTEDNNECGPQKIYQNLEVSNKYYEESYFSPSFLTADGIAYNMQNDEIVFDTNGTKGPNRLGRDIFIIQLATEEKHNIKPGTLLLAGSKLYSRYNSGSDDYYWNSTSIFSFLPCKQNGYGGGCAGRLFEEKGMNY